MGYRVRHKGVPNGMRYEDLNGRERIVLYDGTGSAVARGDVRRVAYDATNKRLCAKSLIPGASHQQIIVAAEPCAADAKGEYYIKGSGITLTVPSDTYTAGDGLKVSSGVVKDTGSAVSYDNTEFAVVEVGGTSDTSITVTLLDKLVDDVAASDRGRFEIFDDFLYQTITEADTPWVLNAGTDGSAADPAIAAEKFGVIQLTTGAGDGSTAQDGSQLVCHIPVQAQSGDLVFETRLHLDAITNVAVNAGLTDSTSLEEPFTIGGSDNITSNASDAACFVFDTSADTDEWFACAVDSNSDDSGNTSLGVAPVAGTYQTLRIEVSDDGGTIKFYINGTLKKTLSNAGVSPDADLYATVVACGDGTASKTVDVDYIYVGHTR